jgi:hypothetical protein
MDFKEKKENITFWDIGTNFSRAAFFIPENLPKK